MDAKRRPPPLGLSVVEFGPFRLEGQHGPLVRDGQEIKLQPKTLALLWLLAQRTGEVVPKRDLLDALWPGQAVGEEALTFQINALRKALGESAKAPIYIGTAHRIGFRFLVPADRRQPLDTDTDRQGAPRVGRAGELAQLSEAWRAVQAGSLQIVLLSGEADIGKTTLIEWFLSREGISPSWIGRGHCVEGRGAEQAYLPIVEALEGWVRRDADGGLLQTLREAAPTWLRQMPSLLDPDEAQRLDRELIRAPTERTQREFAEFLDRACQEQARVIWLEDLHWSDESSIDLLARLASRQTAARLLLLCSLRPVEAIVRGHPVRQLQRQWVAGGRAVDLRLEGLAPEQALDYARKRWTGSTLEDDFLQRVSERSGGHPLFLEQLLSYLAGLPSEQLRRPDAVETAVPERLVELLALQLNLLPAAEQALLEAAALMGFEFSSAGLVAVTELDERTVEDQMDRLAAQGQFVRPSGLEVWPDGTASSTYCFRHALYESLLERRLSPSRRRRMHRLLGERLQGAYGPRRSEVAGRLTRHFEQAGLLRAAVEAGIDVARTALQRSAVPEVLLQRDRCLGLLSQLNPEPRDHALEMTLRLLSVAALQMERGYSTDDAKPDLQRIEALLADVRDTDLLNRAFLALWFRAFHGLRYQEADAVCDRMLAFAEQLGAPELASNALGYRGQLLIAAGKTLETCAVAQEAIAMADQHGHGPTSARPWDGLVSALAIESAAQWALGFPDQAVDNARRAVAVGDRLGDAGSRLMALGGSLTCVLAHRGDWQAVLAEGRPALREAYRRGFMDARLWIERHVTVAEFHLEPSLHRLEAVASALHAHRRYGGSSLAIICCQYADCALMLEDRAQAEQAAALARHLADEKGMVGWLPEILRIEGRLLQLESGQEARAEARFWDAMAIADARQAHGLGLRATLDLHDLLCRLGRRGELRERLLRYDRHFSEGRSTLDLRRLQTALLTG